MNAAERKEMLAAARAAREEGRSPLSAATAYETREEKAAAFRAFSVDLTQRGWRYRSGPTRVWVTTHGKDGFVLVPRWRVILAAFSRKDVTL